MADKDKGSQPTRKRGGAPERKQTDSTNPAHPKKETKPAVPKNDPSTTGHPEPNRGR